LTYKGNFPEELGSKLPSTGKGFLERNNKKKIATF
jgi:hypothetical protein